MNKPIIKDVQSKQYFFMGCLAVVIIVIIAFILLGVKKIKELNDKEDEYINYAPIQLTEDEADYWKEIILKSNSRLRNATIYADHVILELRKRKTEGTK